jgi:hypothetical protein
MANTVEGADNAAISLRRFPIDQRGAIAFKTFFWILLFSMAVYVGYKVVPPTASYYMLRGEVKSEARNAHKVSDEKLAARIFEKAGTWSVPIKREDIIIKRPYGSISINIEYYITYTFFGKYTKVKQFRIDVNVPVKGTRR